MTRVDLIGGPLDGGTWDLEGEPQYGRRLVLNGHEYRMFLDFGAMEHLGAPRVYVTAFYPLPMNEGEPLALDIAGVPWSEVGALDSGEGFTEFECAGPVEAEATCRRLTAAGFRAVLGRRSDLCPLDCDLDTPGGAR